MGFAGALAGVGFGAPTACAPALELLSAPAAALGLALLALPLLGLLALLLAQRGVLYAGATGRRAYGATLLLTLVQLLCTLLLLRGWGSSLLGAPLGELPLVGWAPVASGLLPLRGPQISEFFLLSLSPLKLFFLLLVDLLLPLVLLAFGCQRLDLRRGQPILSLARPRLLFAQLILLLQLLLHLFFLTENLLVFFLCFELSVLPVFAIIGLFGKRSQKFKAMKYLLYFTLFSGVPLLYTLLYFYAVSGALTFGELEAVLPWFLRRGSESYLSAFFVLASFGGFFLPFAVKLAFFPFHSWLPEAHVEASTEGSMLLSGIMLKLGFYGLIRCNLALYFDTFYALAPLVVLLGLLGSLVTALSMYHQVDVKKVIAYSSVVHMNLAVIGYFCFSATAFGAALLMNFSHGLISAALFYAVGLLQDITRSRNLLELSGLWGPLTRWSCCLFVLLLANAGFPGTLGFIGEFPFLCGVFEHYPVLGLLLMLPVALAALRNFILFSQLALGVSSLGTNAPLAAKAMKSFPLHLQRFPVNPYSPISAAPAGRPALDAQPSMEELRRQLPAVPRLVLVNPAVNLYEGPETVLERRPLRTHPFHIAPPSVYGAASALALFFLLGALVQYLHGESFSGALLRLAALGFLWVQLRWSGDMRSLGANPQEYTGAVRRNLTLGVMLFIVSEVMIFFGVFWAYFHSSLNPSVELGAVWPPKNLEVLEWWKWPTLSTALLLFSGFTVNVFFHGLRGLGQRQTLLLGQAPRRTVRDQEQRYLVDGAPALGLRPYVELEGRSSQLPYARSYALQLRRVYGGLIATLLCGALFLLCQRHEYGHAAYDITDGVYGTVFYATTGLHGLHVIAGLLLLLHTFWRLWAQDFQRSAPLASPTATVWYWHFVDIVWLFVYGLVYYWGSRSGAPAEALLFPLLGRLQGRPAVAYTTRRGLSGDGPEAEELRGRSIFGACDPLTSALGHLTPEERAVWLASAAHIALLSLDILVALKGSREAALGLLCFYSHRQRWTQLAEALAADLRHRPKNGQTLEAFRNRVFVLSFYGLVDLRFVIERQRAKELGRPFLPFNPRLPWD